MIVCIPCTTLSREIHSSSRMVVVTHFIITIIYYYYLLLLLLLLLLFFLLFDEWIESNWIVFGLLSPTIYVAMTMTMTSDKIVESSERLQYYSVRCTIFLDNLRYCTTNSSYIARSFFLATYHLIRYPSWVLVHSLVYIKHHASWQLSIQSNEASMKQWSNNEACNQIIKESRIKNQSKIKNLMCLLDFCDWNQSIFLARMNPYKHTKYKDYCSTHVHEYDNSIYFTFCFRRKDKWSWVGY